jgi:hypothetical protein
MKPRKITTGDPLAGLSALCREEGLVWYSIGLAREFPYERLTPRNLSLSMSLVRRLL